MQQWENETKPAMMPQRFPERDAHTMPNMADSKSSSGKNLKRLRSADNGRNRRRSIAATSVRLSEGAVQPTPAVDLGIMRDSISFQLRYTSWAVHAAATHFMPADAVPRQYSVLYLVSLNPGINVNTLAATIGVDQSTLVPTLNLCEDRGWIRRRRGKPDRRVTTLELTKAGHAGLQAVSEMLEVHEKSVTLGISGHERQLLLALLRKVRCNALAAKPILGKSTTPTK